MLKSQDPSESLGFVHTDRFPNGFGPKIGPDRSFVHTEPAIRTAYPVQLRSDSVGPLKKQVQFLNRSGDRFVLVSTA